MKGKPLILKDIVERQEHSIVSREILKEDSGGVTVFAFDKGESLSEHTVSFDALLYIIEGEANVKIDGNSHVLGSGEIIIMPSGKPHSVKADTITKMMLVMIKR